LGGAQVWNYTMVALVRTHGWHNGERRRVAWRSAIYRYLCNILAVEYRFSNHSAFFMRAFIIPAELFQEDSVARGRGTCAWAWYKSGWLPAGRCMACAAYTSECSLRYTNDLPAAIFW